MHVYLQIKKRKWTALVDLDPEIREVAARARAHGEKYEVMLAEKYLALGDKSYLQAAEDFVAKQIDADHSKLAQKYNLKRECPIFCVTGIWSMLIEIGKDEDDDNFQRSSG